MSLPTDAPEVAAAKKEPKQQRRSTRVDVNGWVCLDKPVGLTSTQAVAQVKHLLNAKKAGHAGTLDPLASGVLPIALGEATKTVPIVSASNGARRRIRTTPRAASLRPQNFGRTPARSRPFCRASSA
jgi:hypothetical protein